MKKSEAIKNLISWYHNDLICKEFLGMDQIDLDICKALNIEIPDNKGK